MGNTDKLDSRVRPDIRFGLRDRVRLGDSRLDGRTVRH
ncbi:hypothetical protein CKA32_006844 [Geitlerinema sp. FC II]|nr:hypothetical protein CKA32_006844 [Geitlerinema sp. FC II]